MPSMTAVRGNKAMSSSHVIEVNELNFEYEVLQFSRNVPVLVDFWAPWAKPCRELSPLLEGLAQEAEGGFRLARLNVDANPNLAARFGVRSLPTVKVFNQGEVSGEFVGAQPAARVREFVAAITPPSPLMLAVERANGILGMRQYANAEQMYRKILQQAPAQPECLLGLARALLLQGKSVEAEGILSSFPASRQYAAAEILLPLAQALVKDEAGGPAGESDLDLAFSRALRLVRRGNHAAALDGLLDILRANKRYADGLARQAAVALIELLGDDAQARAYRSELASILF